MDQEPGRMVEFMTSSIDRAKAVLGGGYCTKSRCYCCDDYSDLLRGYIGAIETMEQFAIFHASSCPEAHQGGKCDCRVGTAERAIEEFNKLFPEEVD